MCGLSSVFQFGDWVICDVAGITFAFFGDNGIAVVDPTYKEGEVRCVIAHVCQYMCTWFLAPIVMWVRNFAEGIRSVGDFQCAKCTFSNVLLAMYF